MTWTGPHDFSDGPGNTASGVEVMDNFNYLLELIGESGGGATIGGPGTSLPGSPSNGDEYLYLPDGNSGPIWHMKYVGAASKWLCMGQAPVVKEVTAVVATVSETYAALSGSAGPSFAVPKSGLYVVEVGFVGSSLSGPIAMSYDIGGTAASDNDRAYDAIGTSAQAKRPKTLGAVTLTAKYKALAVEDPEDPGGGEFAGGSFGRRTLSITPVYFG